MPKQKVILLMVRNDQLPFMILWWLFCEKAGKNNEILYV